MSTSLRWRPVRGDESLGSTALKYLLAEKLWRTDGSTHCDWVVLNESFVPFLEGAAAAYGPTSDGGHATRRLIDLIHEHGSVEVAIL